jgi:outer membrane protein TolC
LAIVAVELDIKAPFIELDDVVELATSFRLDLQTARDQIEDAQRAVKVAENGLLPDLNLTAGISGGNFDDTSASSLEPDTTRYAAGITLDFPIDRLSERNIYRRSLIFLQRAQRSFVDLKERIAIAARDALRNIRSAELQLEIQRRGIELAQRRLDYANELLKEGLATSRDVVDAQQSLLEAQDRFASARSQLQISILRYLRDTGTLRLDPSAGALARAMYPVDNGS